MLLVRCIDHLFDDKRLGVSFLMGWLLIVMLLFYNIGLFGGQYMQVGPSPETLFMHVVLDTWYKWSMVACFTAVNTCINDFMSDSISPWLLNTVTDHKTKYLPYPKYQCLLISQLWSLYCGIMGIAGIMISLTQVDFVIIRIACDLLIAMYTNHKFMKDKVFDSTKYYDMDTAPLAQQQQKNQQSSASERSLSALLDDDDGLPSSEGFGMETVCVPQTVQPRKK